MRKFKRNKLTHFSMALYGLKILDGAWGIVDDIPSF